jgi:hypothetical protein
MKIVAFYCLILSFSFLSILSNPTKKAFACTPTVTPSSFKAITINDRTNAAQIIIFGTIVEVEKYQGDLVYLDSSRGLDKATIKVHDYAKGSGPQTVIVQGVGISTACQYEAVIGARGVYFISLDTDNNWWLQTAFAENADIIVQVQNAVKQTPATLPTRITQAEIDKEQFDLSPLCLVGVVGVLTLIISASIMNHIPKLC